MKSSSNVEGCSCLLVLAICGFVLFASCTGKGSDEKMPSPEQMQLEADARRQSEMQQEDEEKAREYLLRKGYAPDVVEATLEVARKEREMQKK